ncbi:MAG TPA: L-threonylcarbamoyladenylate synthase [Candidatus Omnitrophota bacterium]|nr:L-threonylcarbamoyladenylate synthase [Candidatus Omnitrophota bacterium]
MKTEIIKVDPRFPELDKISYCARVIRRGGLVVFPTETVYGIAADFGNPAAMQRLREVKKRSDGKPFSVLISQKGLISNYTISSKTAIYKLIDVYWPGPLTIVVPSKEEGKTIGIRMPDNPVALRLVEESQCTVAAPSANAEGNAPPSTVQEALRDLDGLVDCAIDGGRTTLGRSSTVVDMTQDQPCILRNGAISQEDISRVIGKKIILFVCTGNSCRSVMAEYLLKDYLRGRDNVEVTSAGTGVFIRSTASAETIGVLKEEGLDVSAHRSQPVTTILLKKADLIFVMTRLHRQQILDRVPEVEKRIYLLKEFAASASDTQTDLDIPDPIGHDRLTYKHCLVVIKEAINKIIELV